VEGLLPQMLRRGPHPRTMSGKATYPRRRYTRRGFLRVAATGVAAAACGSVLTACGNARLVRNLRVSPDPARVDEPFAISLKDLSPWQHVTLRAIRRRLRRGVDVEGYVSGRLPGDGGCIQAIPDRRQLHEDGPDGPRVVGLR
jgi:hypothetical protein